MDNHHEAVDACNTEDLRALEQLATEKSSDNRRELMSKLAIMLTEGVDDYSDGSVELLGEILLSLLDQVGEPDRVELSHRVAPGEKTPHKLAKTLAQDQSVRVAAPILAESPVLTDDDLVEIAGQGSQAHLHAMAQRSRVSGQVTDAIIHHGKPPVLQAITENTGAEITEPGFRRLAAQAPGNDGLMEALSRRTDIPEQVAKSVITTMPPVYRERLEWLWSVDAAQSNEMFDEAARQMDQARLSNRRGLLEAKVAATEIKRGIRSLSDVIAHFAGLNHPREVTRVLATIAHIDQKYVSSALFKPNGTPIALICRSINLKDHAFEEISRMRCSRLNLTASQGNRLMQIYRSLDTDTARRTLQFAIARSAALEPNVA